MATRCNVVVFCGLTRVYLYRHWDGYPAETGANIVETLKANPTATGFVRALLAQADEGTSYRGPAHDYEVTSDIHGDVEWLYALRFNSHGNEPEIACSSVPRDRGPETTSRAMAFSDLQSLVHRVNADRREINARMAARGLTDRYPEVTL